MGNALELRGPIAWEFANEQEQEQKQKQKQEQEQEQEHEQEQEQTQEQGEEQEQAPGTTSQHKHKHTSNNNNNNHYVLSRRCVVRRGALTKKGDTFPIFGGRLFETISGYSPNPAILPYCVRTLHFVECRFCR